MNNGQAAIVDVKDEKEEGDPNAVGVCSIAVIRGESEPTSEVLQEAGVLSWICGVQALELGDDEVPQSVGGSPRVVWSISFSKVDAKVGTKERL